VATAPFQLLMDIAPIASAVRVSSTVTVTTTAAHNLTTGAYVQVGNITGAAGTSMAGMFPITVTSGSAFTYTAAGSAGTATVGSAFVAVDLLNPPINLAAGTARQQAMVAIPESLQMSANGDGSGSQMSLEVMQETTPAAGPWFNSIPDNTRIRLVEKDTGTVPTAADVRFIGVVAALTSRLTGSGQGTMTLLDLGDANYLLDKVGVFGKPGSSRTVNGSKFTSSGSTVTVAFSQAHGFVQGQPIKVGGVMLGGTTGGYTGVRRIASVPDAKTITYAATASAGTGARTTQCSFSRVGLAIDRIQITGRYPDLNLQDGDTITLSPPSSISGFTDIPTLRRYLRGTYSGASVQKSGANSVTVIFPGVLGGNWGTFSGYGDVSAVGYVSDVNDGGQLLVTLAGGLTEDATVEQLLGAVNNFKQDDYALQRTFNTAGTASIAGGTSYVNQEAIQFASTSLRSALDTVVETFSGDAKERRYYVGLGDPGTLVYQLVDPTAKPTYANAPYAITTDAGAGNPNTTTAKATVAPFNLTVSYDHETTKNVMMSVPALSGTTYTSVFSYDDLVDSTGTAIFATRSGPVFDNVVDYPTAVRNPGAAIQRAAIAYMTERHKPLLSGQFTLRGAGTAAFNQYGFSSGYAQTGASTFALVSRWEPGQWVEVTSAGLGLSGYYRVEQVDWSLEPGSFTQVINVSFNRKNPSDVATLIATQNK
jgi:hypothetical protein